MIAKTATAKLEPWRSEQVGRGLLDLRVRRASPAASSTATSCSASAASPAPPTGACPRAIRPIANGTTTIETNGATAMPIAIAVCPR